MLVKLVVITLCAVSVGGELLCSGPGRYSTAPGICTNEYYTCNRDVNKEFIVYVLSCPGSTLFNERTRRCSNAKAVSCNPPSNISPSGQIKVTTPSNQKLTTLQTSSWISRPSYGYKVTTLKQLVEYRKPGRLPWVTPMPYLQSTLALATKTKPQKNQWRIRSSTTKKTTSATSTKTFLPVKVIIRRTTNSPVRQIEKTTYRNMANVVHQKTTEQSVNLQISPLYQQTTEVINSTVKSVRTSAAHLFEPLSTLQDKDVNITTTPVLNQKSANPVTPPPFQADTSRNIYTISTQTISNPTQTTVKIKVLDVPSNVICDHKKTQIIPGYVAHPFTISTSPRTSNVENIYETTPEMIIKDSKNSIPFMDSLESSEHSSDMEIVQVDFGSGSNKVVNQMKAELIKQNNNNPIKHIRYFYDPDINPTFNQRLVDRIANSFTMPNKKNKWKIQQKQRRQPK